MSSEVALDALAILVVILCLSALAVSAFFSIPYALRRVRAYPKPGAARTFALTTLLGILAPTAVVGCFLTLGVAILTLPDGTLRQSITRPVLFLGVVILWAQVILVPIGHRYIQEQAIREARGGDKGDRT